MQGQEGMVNVLLGSSKCCTGWIAAGPRGGQFRRPGLSQQPQQVVLQAIRACGNPASTSIRLFHQSC